MKTPEGIAREQIKREELGLGIVKLSEERDALKLLRRVERIVVSAIEADRAQRQEIAEAALTEWENARDGDHLDKIDAGESLADALSIITGNGQEAQATGKTYWVLENGRRLSHYYDEYEAYRALDALGAIAPDSEHTLEIEEA